MKYRIHLLVAACLLVPASAGAAAAASDPAVDCNSAVPPKDFKRFLEVCSSRGPKAGLAAAVASVYDSRTTVANANFANVPTWSDADILAQFSATRDARYMTTTDNPSFQRRISWLYPEDGCYARAEQVDARVAAVGKTRPYKLFAFGQSPALRVYTSNTPSGMVNWWYHVVPVVKNSAGEPIVFDAALSPCKPLPWKTWLAAMVDNMSYYDGLTDGNGVTVADSGAYNPFSLVTGSQPLTQQSLDQQKVTFLPAEWSRQTELGRDPNVVLGSTPPWNGNACVATEVQHTTATVAANSSASVIAACPIGTLNLGGGLMSSSDKLLVYKNARNGNGWEIAAKNIGSTSETLISSAVCLTGAPANASVTTITSSKVTIGKGSNNSATATCSSGVLIGGGFLTTMAGTPSSIMRIFLNGRTTNTSNSWRVSAYNTTSSNRDVTSYAYCLRNTNASVNQTSGNLVEEGMATAVCQAPLLTLGGGFVFPRTTAYSVYTMENASGSYYVDMLPAPPGGDVNAKAYAECMTNP